ncbi:uncharacterized protein TOT_030000195 [Theileria orientalis strain Shintoku]|uniref:RanBP2-type domain-containing protein n=1 Tax=Theileria orientalis strain Shintoku TaxID=869250 RepID=J4DPL9_THEOR|nr:uncharacterized protein TOT_030000195 [Theileria orientalis strain Shintoku]BAM40934.1 uncharacterized protein TOT_030000195 [Theileria orientalis strain Shintoku]|eukprot:XP_009691235.1 uncharacterized protein TOT_030000195 [Theileria orientalis strain Shintoku]
MSTEWVCETCLVKNEASHKSCVCCGTRNRLLGGAEENSSAHLGQQVTNDNNSFVEDSRSFLDDVEQYKVVNRIRMKFNREDLKNTSLFMSGSGEMEQIPYMCLDRHIPTGSNKEEPLYECSIPTPLKEMPQSKIKAVECGALHTAVLTSAGKVYTYGCNDMGALGRLPPTKHIDETKDHEEESDNVKDLYETISWEREPGQVETNFKVKAISCGDNHTLMLTPSGEVYITGGFKDSSGTIGIADYASTEELKKVEYYSVPVKVPITEPIQSIASGENHCVCLAQGGKIIYTFGSNEFSQLLMSNEEVQNPTDKDVDVSEVANLKLLLTWPQRRTVSELLAPQRATAGEGSPKPGEENESHGRTNGLSNKGTEQSDKTRSSTEKTTENKIVPPLRRTRGNENTRDSKVKRSGKKSAKRGRDSTETITRIFTGNCTTFFQTKNMRLYGAGRNGQGEVGVGREERIITHATELEFFRGVEITHLRGGQFFTVSLVEKRIFVWGMSSYLGLPKEYDSKNGNQQIGAPDTGNAKTEKDVEMREQEDIPLFDASEMLTFTIKKEDPNSEKSASEERISTFAPKEEHQAQLRTPSPDEETKMVRLKIWSPNQKPNEESKYIDVPESVFYKICNEDISKIPQKIKVKCPGKSEPVEFRGKRCFFEVPKGYKVPEHRSIKIDPKTKQPLNPTPEQKELLKIYESQEEEAGSFRNLSGLIYRPSTMQALSPVQSPKQVPSPAQPTLEVSTPTRQPKQVLTPAQQTLEVSTPTKLPEQASNPDFHQPHPITGQAQNPVQTTAQAQNPGHLIEKPHEQVNTQSPLLLQSPFYQEVKEDEPGGGPGNGTVQQLSASAAKIRKVKGQRLKVEEAEGVDRLLNFDYAKRCDEAFETGRATEPILLPMSHPVESIFTGSDAAFAILEDDSLYSWGSSQNYILGNGKDQNFEETPQQVPSEFFPGFRVIGGAGGSQHTVFLAEKA